MPVFTGTALNNLSYNDLMNWVRISSGNTEYLDKYIAEAAKYGIDEMSAVEDMAATYMNFYKDGNGSYTITSFNADAQISSVNPIDSNIGTISRGNVQTPLNRAKDAITNKIKITRFPASGSFTQRASYVLGSVGSATAAVSTGITLGKVISPLLYQANPNFWESIGVNEGSFDPQTWSSITNGDDSWQAGLFNLILGLDPDTGDSQLYMDENAFAYMAYALAQNGFFGSDIVSIYDNLTVGQTITSDDVIIGTVFDLCMLAGFNTIDWTAYYPSREAHIPAIMAKLYGDYVVVYDNENSTFLNGSEWTITNVSSNGIGTTSPDILDHSYGRYWYRGATKYSATISAGAFNGKVVLPDNVNSLATGILLAKAMTPPEGVTNQSGATLPDASSWDDVDDVLPSLQQQYPDLWNNPLVWDNYQPDGTNPQKVYIPVATPSSTTGTSTQPTSSNSTQANPQVNPATSTQALIDFLTNVMTQPNPQTNPQTQTETDTQPKIPSQNPVIVGTGETPTPIAPTGSASALWSVYHPSQAQVDSFGAWLWTGNIITQIQQLLQNPMEGIITLHKVFATPVDSGTGTIVVGRLDSEVPSATVTQQYVTVDCGSIDCYEEFGNVFDYSPYTDVSLYLPFIGIVPLNVSDIMRSTIHVIYGVDVFTGACLAMVEVTRDGNTINLYQYAGMASVEYPLTGSVHSGLVTGLLGVAGSIAATVATGGVGAPAAIAAVGGLASAGTSHNARAGGFSGNAGAMGIKTPYLIIERPQTKVAETFPELAGYPTNYSCKLSECSGHVVVKHVHVEGLNATDSELDKINSILKSGVIV